MARYFTIIFLLLLSTPVVTLACTFIPDPFCDVFDTDTAILHGRSIEIIDQGVRFEIITHIRGEEQRDTVIIYDQLPFECNGEFSLVAQQFAPLGAEVVIALPQVDTLLNPWETIGDYRVPNYWLHTTRLEVEAGEVKGNITQPFGIQSMPLDDLIIEVQDGTANCSIISNVTESDATLSLSIYPNPTSDYLYITLDESQNLWAVSLVDIYGREFYRSTADVNTIDVSGMPVGSYILRARHGSGAISNHIIVITD